MEGLSVDGQSEHSRLSHGFDALSGADMDEVHRAPGLGGEPDHAPEGYVLGEVGVDAVHVPPVPEAVFPGVIVVVVDHVVVFGVDEEHASGFRHSLHDRGQATEVGLVVLHLGTGWTDGGREDLEAGESLGHELGDLVYAGPVRAVGEYRMVGIVGVGAAVPAFGGLVKGVPEVVAGNLGGEVEDGGRSSPDGGAGHGFCARSLRLSGAADVRVGFDASGDDDLARGVDDSRVSGGN